MGRTRFGVLREENVGPLAILVLLLLLIMFSKSTFDMSDSSILKLDSNSIKPVPFKLPNGKTVLSNNCLPRSTVGPNYLPNPYPSTKCVPNSLGKMVAANSFGFITPCVDGRPSSCDLTTGFTGPGVPSNPGYDYSTNACQVNDLGYRLGTPYNIYSISGGKIGPAVVKYDGINVVPNDGYSDSKGNPFLQCDKTKKPLGGWQNYILQVPSTNNSNNTSIYYMEPDSRNQTCIKGKYVMDI